MAGFINFKTLNKMKKYYKITLYNLSDNYEIDCQFVVKLCFKDALQVYKNYINRKKLSGTYLITADDSNILESVEYICKNPTKYFDDSEYINLSTLNFN